MKKYILLWLFPVVFFLFLYRAPVCHAQIPDGETSVELGEGLSVINIPVRESTMMTYSVNFNTHAATPYTVSVKQRIFPENNGVDVIMRYDTQWVSSISMMWQAHTKLIGRIPGTYELITTATIAETGQQDEFTTTVNVNTDKENPVLAALGSIPDALSVSIPADVTFTISIADSILKPVQVTLDQVYEQRMPARVLGDLIDDGTSGDLMADDYVYSGTFKVKSDTEGKLLFRVRAVYDQELEPVNTESNTRYSNTYSLGVTRFPTELSPSDMSKVIVDPATGEKVVADEVLVSFVEGTEPNTMESIVNSIDGTIVGTIFGLGIYQIRIPYSRDISDLKKALRLLGKYPEVNSAELNAIGEID